MGRILIVKTGGTFPSMIAEKGDFEDWILSGMGLSGDHAIIKDVSTGDPLPTYGELTGAVVTGSPAMVSEHRDWMERTAEWLAGAAHRRIPVLGICFGHQLLAYALGGEVGDNPNGREMGTVEIRLNENAGCDRLLGNVPSRMFGHVSHKQSVLRLPDGAMGLASSNRDAHQAFAFKDSAWGVQFHPEFDAAITAYYIRERREALLAENQDPDALIEEVTDTPHASGILGRFAELADARPVPARSKTK